MRPEPANLRVVANAAKQPVGDTRRSAGTKGNFSSAILIDGNLHHLCRAGDDEAKFLFGVELETQQNAKARTQGRRKQAGPGSGANKSEGANLHHVRARRGTLPDDDVEFVVLERGVEFLFQHRLHAVDFVKEKHLALAQIGQDGGEVALDLEGGAGGLLEAHVEFIGNDGGKSGFAQAWRPEEKNVIERLAARFCGFKRDGKLLLALVWPMNSPSQRGRSLSSKPCSSSARAALTRRSGVLSRAMAMLEEV